MTTRRNPFVKLVLLLIVAAALAVAGCGGDDGVNPSVHQDALDAQAAAEEAARLAAEEKAAEEAARIAAEEKAAEEAAARLAAEEAARLAAEQAAAEEAARIAAEQQAAEEEAARLAAEEAAAAEAARLAAEQAAADAARERMAAIDTAQDNLASAEAALMALGEDATNEETRDAQRMVEATANTLRDVLRANGGSEEDIEAAIGKAVTAKIAADALQATITAAASAAAQARMANIATAQTTLSDAETALMALADDATDEAQRDAQRAVEMAAAALVQVLMDNEGTADQIAAATMKQESAKMMADGLQATITAAAEAAAAAQMLADQRSAIASAITAATSAVSAVNNDSTDAEVSAAEMAIAAITAAINAATDVPDSEKAANTVTVVTLTGQLATAKATRMAAMDAAAMAAAMAEQMRKITEAKGALDAAWQAVFDTTNDEDRIAALRGVEAAASNLRDVLRANGGSEEDIDEATQVVVNAKGEADYLQQMIDDAVAEAERRKTAQETALMEAAGNVDTSDLTTAEDIATARAAIDALKLALVAAVDVSDADKAIYQATVDVAEAAVMTAQSVLNHTAQTMVLSAAVTALQEIDLSDLTTEEKIGAAQDAIAALRTALEGDELSDADKTPAMFVLTQASLAVTRAQTRVDIAGQMMTLSDAVNTLEGIDLDALMTQEDIDAANRAIDALEMALGDATDLTDAQKLDATLDLRSAMRKVASAQTVLNTNIDNQRMALTNAGEGLADIDLDDLDTSAKVNAAQAALDALKKALEGATHLSDADKAMYQTQLEMATETVKTAQTGMDLTGRMAAQRTAITTTMMNARTAVAGVDNDSTDTEVAAADAAIAALKMAIDDADDLPEGDTDVAIAKGTLDTLEGQLTVAKTARTDYLAKKGDEDMKAATATGKALYAALAGPEAGGNALANIATAPTFSDTGDLMIPVSAAGAGALAAADTNPAATLKAGDSAGALGSWNGMDYALTTGTGDNKVTNEARVYTNKSPGKSQPFSGADGKYTLITTEGDTKGYVLLGDATTPVMRVMGAPFAHSGTQTYTKDAEADAVYLSGTYDGAPGRFRCSGNVACTVTNDGEGGPSALGGTWHFRPNAGAMVTEPDADYLYYGWWVSKDSKGMPTAASAFRGTVGEEPAETATAIILSDGVALSGSATYAGHAAGKFAINNVLAGTGNGGHFTADAMLTATFGTNDAPNNGGVTGMIDNFRLNDGSEDPGWSVMLNRAPWGTTGAFTSMADTTNTVAEGTVWSINDNSASESGVWSGQMYDELPGTTDDDPPGDGSTLPTTVTGTFYSEFSSIGRMVGGFGANKE